MAASPARRAAPRAPAASLKRGGGGPGRRAAGGRPGGGRPHPRPRRGARSIVNKPRGLSPSAAAPQRQPPGSGGRPRHSLARLAHTDTHTHGHTRPHASTRSHTHVETEEYSPWLWIIVVLLVGDGDGGGPLLFFLLKSHC